MKVIWLCEDCALPVHLTLPQTDGAVPKSLIEAAFHAHMRQHLREYRHTA